MNAQRRHQAIRHQPCIFFNGAEKKLPPRREKRSGRRPVDVAPKLQ